MKSSASSGLRDEQSASLSGSPPDSRPDFRLVRSRALRAASRALAAVMHFSTIRRASARIPLEPLGQIAVENLLDIRADLGVAELRFRLTLELGIAHSHGEHRGQALTDVLAGEVVVLLLEQTLLASEGVDRIGHRLAEALFMGSAFMRVDVVGEGKNRLGIGAGPLHRQLQLGFVRAIDRSRQRARAPARGSR